MCYKHAAPLGLKKSFMLRFSAKKPSFQVPTLGMLPDRSGQAESAKKSVSPRALHFILI